MKDFASTKERSGRITKCGNVFRFAFKLWCRRLEFPMEGLRFCYSIHRERDLAYYVDKWQSFTSTFLYKLKKVQNLPFL